MITIIAAVAKNGAIGYENKLLYWLPNDLKRFKALTTGHTIIMGRRTFESLPNGALPNRRNVVVSRSVRGERREERLRVGERSSGMRGARCERIRRWSISVPLRRRWSTRRATRRCLSLVAHRFTSSRWRWQTVCV